MADFRMLLGYDLGKEPAVETFGGDMDSEDEAQEGHALTADELLSDVRENIQAIARAWSRFDLKDRGPMTPEDDRFARCEGTIHSLLAYLDGVSSGSPCSFKIVAEGMGPDQIKDEMEDGGNWVEADTVIAPGEMLHDALLAPRRSNG